MRLNKTTLYVFLFGLLILLSACSGDNHSPTWQTITATDARSIMNETENFVILDVRTLAEFLEIRIDGAILIPFDEILDSANTKLTDKNTTIFVYCRTGRRSALAASDLVTLGFTAIYDFGGIVDWLYETISG